MGSSVGEIFAHDPDEGPNAVVQYSIIGEIVFLPFIINVPSVPLFEPYSLNFNAIPTEVQQMKNIQVHIFVDFKKAFSTIKPTIFFFIIIL